MPGGLRISDHRANRSRSGQPCEACAMKNNNHMKVGFAWRRRGKGEKRQAGQCAFSGHRTECRQDCPGYFGQRSDDYLTRTRDTRVYGLCLYCPRRCRHQFKATGRPARRGLSNHTDGTVESRDAGHDDQSILRKLNVRPTILIPALRYGDAGAGMV
jgi:hypothetical protein